jgi:hypothetical protein
MRSTSPILFDLMETLDPATPPPPNPPAFGLVYDGAIGQQRQTTSLCDSLLIGDFNAILTCMLIIGREGFSILRLTRTDVNIKSRNQSKTRYN